MVFFEAPHRIGPALTDLGTILGTRQICVARELTKSHQEFVTGAANDTIFLAITRKGEFSVVIGPADDDGGLPAEHSDIDIVESFRSVAQSGATSGRREAAGEVARKLGLTANEVYRALERSKL
jgi:16S rRNA (cytidine1402-2'-O)-methyltransferase